MVERTITLTYKSGGSCQHTGDQEESEWTELGMSIGLEFRKASETSVLTLLNPYGLHRISDLTAFHITDYEPPEGDRRMGFV